MQVPKNVDTDTECSVDVSSLSASSPTSPILVPICIQEEAPLSPPFSTNLKVFIDSGAMGNFIHPRIVKQLEIPTKPCPTKLQLQTVTGNKFFAITQQVHITLTTMDKHMEKIVLDVAPIGKHDLILGIPWCTYHGIQFDWQNRKILAWSPECKGKCFTTLTLLLVKVLSPEAVPPVRATEGAIGYDLHTTGHHVIQPQHRQLLPTGIAVKLLENTYGRITPRSGLAAKATVDVAAGVINPDYQGKLKVLLVNNGNTPFEVKPGDRVTQLILENTTLEDILVTDTLEETT